MRSIGERLKEWRQAAGMKQDIAAMRMGMSRTTLSAIEAGKREVLAKEIPGFVSLYGKSPEELLEGLIFAVLAAVIPRALCILGGSLIAGIQSLLRQI